MTTPALLGLATQLPAHRHLQMDLHDRWLFPFIHSQRARAIFAAAEIESRYSVMADSSFLDSKPTTQARNQLYLETARPLALAVIQQALANAKLTPRDLDHFIITSCTGWDTPGLEVTLAAELGMKPTLRRTALMGMGCRDLTVLCWRLRHGRKVWCCLWRWSYVAYNFNMGTRWKI